MDDILIKDKDGEFKIIHEGKVMGKEEATAMPKKSAAKKGLAPAAAAPKDLLEDEKEIIAFKDIKRETFNEKKNKMFERIGDEIIESAQISFPKEGELLRNRLHNIISARLKGIRSNMLVRETLERPVQEGGIGLTINKVDKIINEIKSREPEVLRKLDELKQEFAKEADPETDIVSYRKEIAPPPPALANVRKAYESASADEQALGKILQKKKIQTSKTKKNNPGAGIKSVPPPPPALSEKAEKENITFNIGDAFKPVPPPPPPPAAIINKEAALPAKPAQDEKQLSQEKVGVSKIPKAKPIIIKRAAEKPPTMQDIKPPAAAFKEAGMPVSEQGREVRRAKLVSPIEELRAMTLKDFRLVSENPMYRIDKIAEKVNLLEEQSYVDKLKGIEAWKESDVYNLYVEIGYECMSRGMPVEQIIIERQEAGKPTLTKEEFNAINELNRRLSF